MGKSNVVLIGAFFFAMVFCVSCNQDTLAYSAAEGTVLETGYEIDNNLEIVSPQTNFKAGTDFYFSFYNNRPFGGREITVELSDSETGRILAEQVYAEGTYDLGPDYDRLADMIWLESPGRDMIKVAGGGEERAVREVIVER